MEATFSKIEDELKEINVNGEELKRTNLELFEVMQVLELTQQFFEQVSHHHFSKRFCTYDHPQLNSRTMHNLVFRYCICL